MATSRSGHRPLVLSKAEWAILGCVGAILIGSLIPLTVVPQPENLWSSAPLFLSIAGVVLPVIYAIIMVAPTFMAWAGMKKLSEPSALVALRTKLRQRVQRWRIGSLSVRQFGQVVAWLSLGVFALQLVGTLSAVLFLGTTGAAGLVLVTVFDRQIFGHALQPATIGHQLQHKAGQAPAEPAEAVPAKTVKKEQAAPQPYWFAVDSVRQVWKEHSEEIAYELHPGQWYLCVRESASGMIVRNDDGDQGLLKDVSGVERG